LLQHIMPPTPQAVTFVLAELWDPSVTEAFICHFWPPGVVPGHLRALLTSPPFSDTPYHDHLVDIGLSLVMVGHQRSLGQILQGMGALPLVDPLPPIEVRFSRFYAVFFCYFLPFPAISDSWVWRAY
jgi:hypothetical protein